MGTWSPGPGPSDGDDVYTGDGAVDNVDGGLGNDTLSGFGGADTLNGGDGNDILYGSSFDATGTIVASTFITGLAAPVAGASTSADPGFLYFVEKGTGIIWRVDAGTGARTTFLDIPQGEFNSSGERGVLGLAFHPDYVSNGRFFVYLTDTEGDIQIREYTRSANPAIANTTWTLITEIARNPSLDNHNGGWIGFSPEDGYLYFATGDGGSGGDPSNNAQNPDSLLGKLIRIDVDGPDAFPADPNRNYAIPADNPFVGIAGADEIWAYGLRNPWRIAFDPRNGDLYIADVGQSAREEVDYLPNGEGGVNFGWRIMEGNLPYNPGPPGTPQPGDPSLRLPIFDYPRTVGTSITGGEVYLGPVTGFAGQYIFGDFGSGRIFTLSVANGAAVDPTERTSQITGATPGGIVDFVTGTDGRLYVIGIGGTVWLLTPGVGAEDVGDILNGGTGNDQLFGGVGADQLNGNDDNDLLNGGAGADTMRGGNGNDTYVVDNAGDITIEASPTGGIDTVESSVTRNLTANIENLTLTGAAAITGNGNALNNVITGNAAANLLYGFDGNDRLDGGAGADTMYGGNGDDTYVGDNAGDQFVEASPSGGNDTVETSITRNLTANIENLVLTGAAAITGYGNVLNNSITGNSAANLLYGFDGADFLDGGAGADTMYGANGDDTYYVDDANDLFIEGSPSGGVDTVVTTVTRNLTANIENLSLIGSAAISGYGNVLNNTVNGNGANNSLYGLDGADRLNGNGGDDVLFGGNGDDELIGGLGADTLVGGAGADTFVFNDTPGGGNVDTISGFSVADDTISLGIGASGALSPGALNANAFVIGAAAADADDRIIYNSSTGQLFYDADGNGAGVQVLFATLAPGLALTNADFIVGGP